jgi:two-component system, chemotaxis family, CheB/CheR fusion protein
MSTDPAPDTDHRPPEDEPAGVPFPVVGVGASAGGLEAYSELFEALPADPGMAFLVVSHLDPEHKSHLPEILGRVSKMPVREVKEGMKVEKDHVYVIPAGATMTLVDGHLTLSSRPPKPVPHMPIDHLFRSLAAIQKGRAAAVVLSGNGTDGAIGLHAVKAVGGLTFAQDESSARHPGMPRTAALDGSADHVLRPREIARQLERVGRHPYARQADDAGPAALTAGGDPVADIIRLLLLRTAVDFSAYKQTTIRRRILRRMALLNLQDAQAYLGLLRDNPAEVQALYQDFLIRVTQFFRDPAAFEALKEKVLPALTNGRRPGAPIRVWVAGCATGEEVYSLAISLLEFLDARAEAATLKILATDLNEVALEKARTGVYLDNIEADVSPERLRRFFVRTDGTYQISKAVRELCVFSRHNLTADPPFSRLDLVSCRNVLIYMDTALQKRVIPVLHYSLNPDGYLFLGGSENIGTFTDLFTVADAKHRIFAKRTAAGGLALDYQPRPAVPGLDRPAILTESGPPWSALDVQKEADRILLARYAPVGVVVDEAMTVLQFRGRTAAFLEPAPGMASLDLFRMLRNGLLAEVRAAVTQAKAENTVATRDGLSVLDGGAPRAVRVEVVPFRVAPAGVRFFLVLFQEAGRPQAPAPADRPPAAADPQASQLQQELTALREYLQSVIEQQESTNEELKSANEEILSANEELQSTNEELQTAKEEAQSANEELATVNEELRHRNAELARVNNDLVNLLTGVNIPIVMVGRDLRIRRFTPLAEKPFNLIPTDVGRPIGQLKPDLDGLDLTGLITRVIDTLAPFEGEVRDASGHWYQLRVRPYVTLDQKIDGASVVLLDIDAWRRGPGKPGTPPVRN